MKSRDVLLASTAAGLVLGGAGWLLTRKLTEVGPVEPVRLGEAFPTVTGTTLSGESLVIPDDLQGRVAVLVLADNYNARFEVEAWLAHLLEHYADEPGLAYYQVALISGIGPLMRKAIDAAMVRGTTDTVQGHTLTVYGDLRSQRRRLGMRGLPQAYVFLLGRTGRIAWHAHGRLDDVQRAELDEALAAQGIEGVQG